MSGPVNFTAGANGGHLIVTSNNWETTKKCWPKSPVKDVSIIEIDGSDILFQVEEIIPLARNCDIILKLFESLYFPSNPEAETATLQVFVAEAAIKLKRFYGHLNQAGVDMLPRTIKQVALAIGSAADVEAIQSLVPWRELDELLVAVTPLATLEDLGPLPNVTMRGIFFPGLTDERVNIVVPAIAALVPQRIVSALYFPKSLLTSAGALRLAEAIREMEPLQVKYTIVIEPSGDWKPDGDWSPDEDEKSLIEAMLLPKIVIPSIKWTMSWIYE